MIVAPPVRCAIVDGKMYWNAQDIVALLEHAAREVSRYDGDGFALISQALDGLARDMAQYLEEDHRLIPTMMVLPV